MNMVYSNKNISITYLILQIILHLFIVIVKKTGFIILEGEANIQLGLYKSTSENLKHLLNL